MVFTMALSIYVNCEIHINLAEGEIYTKYITHKVLLIIRDRDRMVVWKQSPELRTGDFIRQSLELRAGSFIRQSLELRAGSFIRQSIELKTGDFITL